MEYRARKHEYWELLVLFSVALLPSLIGSLMIWVFPDSDIGWVYFSTSIGRGLLHALTSLLLFGYVIGRNGERLADFGFRFRLRSIAWACALVVVCISMNSLAATYLPKSIAQTRAAVETDASFASLRGAHWTLRIGTIIVLATLEEVFLRVYLLTRLRQLGWNQLAALAISVFITLSLHLYRGSIDVLFFAPLAVMFGIYYLHKRDAWAIIIAHSMYNWLALS